MLSSKAYEKNLIGIVEDEAQCISHSTLVCSCVFFSLLQYFGIFLITSL